MSEWRRENGVYVKADGKCKAMVMLEGEIWRTYVYFEGAIIDQGEWDSRGVALRNADGAIRRARKLRDPCRAIKEEDEDEEEFD